MRLAVVTVVLASFLAKSRGSPCPQTTRECGECIRANPQCAWCADVTYRYSRCGELQTLRQAGCNPGSIHFPPRQALMIHKAKRLSKRRLVTPQAATLKLRRGAWTTLPVTVKATENTLSVRFRHPRQVKLKVSSSCKQFRWKKPIAKCGQVRPGEVYFNVTVMLKSCMPRPKRVKLIPEGQKKSTLKVSIVSACGCDCEKHDMKAKAKSSRERCSRHGNHTCGVCVCEPGRSGRYCECEEKPSDVNTCRFPGKKELCSNQGNCVCGFCECFEKRYSGAYCECDTHSCEKFEGEICGGDVRGYCMCGKCQCEPGYTGVACEKKVSDKAASKSLPAPQSNNLPPDNACRSQDGVVCSGRGVCVDTMCVCKKRFKGKLCEKTKKKSTRRQGRSKRQKICGKTKPCVQCKVFDTGPLRGERCAQRCSHYHFRYLDSWPNSTALPHINPMSNRSTRGVTHCKFQDDDGCFPHYSYFRHQNKHVIEAKRSKVCP